MQKFAYAIIDDNRGSNIDYMWKLICYKRAREVLSAVRKASRQVE